MCADCIMAASIAALPAAHSVNNNGGSVITSNNMSEKAPQELCSGSDSETMSISLQLDDTANNESTGSNSSIVKSASIESQPIITISGSFTDGNSVSTQQN